MSRKVAQKPLEPSDQSPIGWARWWFAMGCQQAGTVHRLVEQCGVPEEEAESIFRVMMGQIAEEVEDLRRNFAARSEALYREIKNDEAGDWGTRQKAQIELEKLLNLVAVAQTEEGLQSVDVLEAMVFHETLIDDPASTAPQRLRSQRRQMLLLGQGGRSGGTAGSSSSGSTRRGSFSHDDESRFAPPPRTNALPDAHCGTSQQCHPEDEHGHGIPDQSRPSCRRQSDAAIRRNVLAALEQDAEELDAEFARLVHEEGVTPEQAAERLEPLRHENTLRQTALRDLIAARATPVDPSPAPAPPVPHAQGPPA